MWPLKSTIPSLREVKVEDESDTITLIHTQGGNKFSKRDVLNYSFEGDIFSPSVENYSLVNTFLLFALFGGFLNMFFSFSPIIVWDKSIRSDVRSEFWFAMGYWPYTFWIYIFILIVLAALFSYLFYLMILSIVKKYRINNRSNKYRKDILSISFNNYQIMVRIGSESIEQELSFFFNSEFENRNIQPKDKERQFHCLGLAIKESQIYSLTSAVFTIYVFNHETPFWFNQFFKENVFSTLFTENTFLYFKYFGTWNGTEIINKMNPILAFFDGALSNAVFFIFVFILISHRKI